MTTSLRVLSPTPLDQMIDAVDIEIDAVAQRSRVDFVRVTRGLRQAMLGCGAIYVFEHTGGRRPHDDERVLGQFDDVHVHGFIVAVGEGMLTVALEADLGASIHEGKLIVDKVWLWTTLRERLETLRRSDGQLNLRNVGLLTGQVRPRMSMLVADSFSNCGPALNAEQKLLYGYALASDATYGWGPPGTGKTVVCERIVADGYYPRGQSSLYTGPTNKAVDLGLARILDRLAHTGRLAAALAAGHIIRVGPISDPALRDAYGEQISLDVLVAGRLLSLGAPQDAGRDAAALEARVRAEIVGAARIVATTVHRVYIPGQVERQFDAVVLDEAGMINLPAACCAAVRARSHAVVMGDFRQLGAITTSEHPTVREWVRRDAFRAAGVVGAVERGEHAPGLVALRVQHRSDPAIASLVNTVAYGHAPLVTHPSVRARPPLSSPWGTDALMLVDTTPLRAYVRKAPHGGSRSNPVHASVVRWLVQELANTGGIPADPDDANGVVLLVPFRDQRRLVGRHLPPALLTRALDVSTVHRYQGDERGTVILDLVDARGLKLSRFMRATTLDDDGARLVNVACSRARRRLIVVMPVNYLLHHAPRGPVQDFVRYVARHAMRIEIPVAQAHQALTYVERWEQRRGP